MITFESKGSFDKTEAALKRMTSQEIYKSLSRFAEKGRAALEAATPTDTSETARAWTANVFKKGSTWRIVWSNSHVENGVPVVILLQYGHGTGTGGYVQGRDFINPAIQPIFDEISRSVWEEVIRA